MIDRIPAPDTPRMCSMKTGDSTMTPRERLLAVMRHQEADCVPALADLSWWYAAHGGGRFVPSVAGNEDRLARLLELHRQTGAAIHLNTGSFFDSRYREGVRASTRVEGDCYRQCIETPHGVLEEVRRWSDRAWSWGIEQHMIRTVEDLKLLRWAYAGVTFAPRWERFVQVEEMIGPWGLAFASVPYSGMGFLMARYAGVEKTVELAMDEPAELDATLAVLNDAHARAFTLMAEGPAQVLFVSDNLSADVQSPTWFARYSAAHYRKLAQIAHAQGKVVSVHIDGRLRGLLRAAAECGIDGADAVTPWPWGDLTPEQCRAEAGPALVLSGGVPPNSFAASVPLATFDAQVERWLALADSSGALMIAPGDQLPPDGELARVTRLVAQATAVRPGTAR